MDPSAWSVGVRDLILSIPDYPRPGVSFKDITPLLAEPAVFRGVVDRLVGEFAEDGIDKVAAFDARGFLFGAPIALALQRPLVPIRKSGKLPRRTLRSSYQGEYGSEEIELHADAVCAGERVLLVDDVIALGNCMRCGCELIERLGGVVAGCASVIRITYLGADERLSNYKLVSVVCY